MSEKMSEKKTLHILLPFSDTGIRLIKKTDNLFKNSNSTIYQKKPWFLKVSCDLNSFGDIPLEKIEHSYGISYNLGHSIIMITFNKNNILFEYLLEIEEIPTPEDYSLIKEWFQEKEIAIGGFETDLEIESPFKSIEKIIDDTSLHPIIVIKQNLQEEYGFEGEWSMRRINLLRYFIEPLLK